MANTRLNIIIRRREERRSKGEEEKRKRKKEKEEEKKEKEKKKEKKKRFSIIIRMAIRKLNQTENYTDTFQAFRLNTKVLISTDQFRSQ